MLLLLPVLVLLLPVPETTRPRGLLGCGGRFMTGLGQCLKNLAVCLELRRIRSGGWALHAPREEGEKSRRLSHTNYCGHIVGASYSCRD